MISVAGCCLQDNIQMITKALEIDGVSSIEINLACPNIPGKPITAYDFEMLDDVLYNVTKIPNLSRKPIGIKLAPYFDLLHFDKAASIIAKYPIQYLVTANSMGNCLVIDADRECSSILPKGGLGGLGGSFVCLIGLLASFLCLFTSSVWSLNLNRRIFKTYCAG